MTVGTTLSITLVPIAAYPTPNTPDTTLYSHRTCATSASCRIFHVDPRPDPTPKVNLSLINESLCESTPQLP